MLDCDYMITLLLVTSYLHSASRGLIDYYVCISCNFSPFVVYLYIPRDIMCFIYHFQTRGSIPLQWSQRPTLKYKPAPVILDGVNQVKQ